MKRILALLAIVSVSCGKVAATDDGVGDAGARPAPEDHPRLTDDAGGGVAVDAGTPEAPYKITCSFGVGNDVSEIVYVTNEPRNVDIELLVTAAAPAVNVPVRTKLANAADDATAVDLTIDLPGVTRLTRLSRMRRPMLEFPSGGFTGHTSVSVVNPDVKSPVAFFCEASALDRPPTSRLPHEQRPPPWPQEGTRVPHQIRCTVNVASADRPETIEIQSGTNQIKRAVGDLKLTYHNERSTIESSLSFIHNETYYVEYLLNPLAPLAGPGLGDSSLTGLTILRGLDGAGNATTTTFGCASR
jgi:hypothetical protein